MNQLNSVILEGNLTRDPVSKETPQGKMVCTFIVASNRYYRDRKGEVQTEVSFVEVETWGQHAERCAKELIKGQPVKVVGRLKQDRWQGQDEQLHSRVKIVAEHVEIQHFNRASEEEAAEELTS